MTCFGTNFLSVKHFVILSFEVLSLPVNPGMVSERNSAKSYLSLFSETLE